MSLRALEQPSALIPRFAPVLRDVLFLRVRMGLKRHLRLRRAEGADGTEWEIRVLRFVPPSWQAADPQMLPYGSSGYEFESPLSTITNGFLLPFFRVVIEFPWAVWKGRKAGVTWIEARSFYPAQQSLFWMTSPERVAAAVEAIASQFEAGVAVPRVEEASFVGTHQA